MGHGALPLGFYPESLRNASYRLFFSNQTLSAPHYHWAMPKSIFTALPLGLALVSLPAAAPPPTKEDSGWVSLYNGTNFDGFYAYFQDVGVVEPDKQDAFVAEPGIIHVPKAHGGYSSTEGHIITRKVYSWYRVRVDYRFSTDINSQNAGLIVHIDNDAALIGKTKVLRPAPSKSTCAGARTPPSRCGPPRAWARTSPPR